MGIASREKRSVRNGVFYKRLDSLEDDEKEVIWMKIMPKKLPRRFSCILLACLYYTQHTVFLTNAQSHHHVY